MGLIPKALTVLDTLCMDGCCKALQLEDEKEVFWNLQTIGLYSNSFTYPVFVHRLCKGQKLEDGIGFGIDMLVAAPSIVANLLGWLK
ncbi:pentatricopeptide repeat-containing protein At4g11690-like [Aristolochia californica]|uniref:pentatricopeptide repeat-containing protein At4g11690-like n=1 Tax=Aristolochia californica TaxID=171875 RepID=UPI0035E2E928